jgi:hypothetical protein
MRLHGRKRIGELNNSGIAELTFKDRHKIPAITYHRLLLLIALVLDSFNLLRRLPDE